MNFTSPQSLTEEILRLKKERGALLLAHVYQIGEVQDMADVVGDSLALARAAAGAEEPVIVLCGVHFMAETAALLCPGKTVLIPDRGAGCSLASTVDVEALRAWKASHPGALVVTYINSTAEVKAESDIVCTSSNAVRVVESLPADKEILFIPDMFLGQYVREKTGRRIHLWPGSCHVHYDIHDCDLDMWRARYPDAEVLVHPECGCLSSALEHADRILSTSGMIRRVKESPARTFVVATEKGILHQLEKQSPSKTFIPAARLECEFMKKITLEKLLASLREMKHVVTVPPDTARRAKAAVDRMMALPG